MARIRHLKNAPIVEAVFDFRVKPSKQVTGKDFLILRGRLEPEFTRIEERREQRVTFTINPTQPTPPKLDDLGVLGMIFMSDDGKTQAHLRNDGMTVNRLAPYTSWEELEPIIRKTWAAYLDIAKPESVVRLAMRFINRLSLPESPFEIEHYLAAGPVIPEVLPQEFGAFLNRLTLIDRKRELACNVLQAIEQSGTKRDTFLLDVDAYSNRVVDPTSPNVWEQLSAIRTFKNEVFFGHLEEPALEEYA